MLSYLSLMRQGEREMEQRKSPQGGWTQSGFHEFWKPSVGRDRTRPLGSLWLIPDLLDWMVQSLHNDKLNV